MKVVRIVKQWRGHDPGTEPELTDERAAELLTHGFAEEIKPVVKAKVSKPKRKAQIDDSDTVDND